MSSLETAKDTHVDENRIEMLTEGKYLIEHSRHYHIH